MKQEVQTWTCGRRVVSLEKPVLVGILNVTPDSFSDGGLFEDDSTAVAHAMGLVNAGADIIDVGGESTRPGATRVSSEEQIVRTKAIIQAIRSQSNVCISIDTTCASVAKEAISAGANIINDVSSGTEDENIFELAAETGVGLVLMHRRLPPELDQYSDTYEAPFEVAIVQDVIEWLLERSRSAERAGVHSSAIALDPGFGFGKNVEQNWKLVEAAEQFVATGYPIYAGLSRKSFIGSVSGMDDPNSRDTLSAVAMLEMARKGVHIFRVHNVQEHVRVLQSLSSIEH